VWVEGSGLPGALYVRVQDVDGVPRVTELYVDGRGEAIEPRALRELQLSRVEIAAQEWHVFMSGAYKRAMGDLAESGIDTSAVEPEYRSPGPDLSRLAAYFQADPTSAPGWVGASMLAQKSWPSDSPDDFPQVPYPEEEPARIRAGLIGQRPPSLRERAAASANPPIDTVPEMPELEGPPNGRLTDEFLLRVAEAYRIAVLGGDDPAEAIRRHMTPRPKARTVQSWFGKARQRGLMLPAARTGRVGRGRS
jgi:hypothetical protein